MNGHHVIPFSMKDEKNYPSEYERYFISNIDFRKALRQYRISSYPKVVARVLYSLEAKKKIGELIKKTRPDVAHIHGIAHEMSPSIIHEIKKFNIPIVQTLHDYKILCPNTNFVSNEAICERCKNNKFYNVILKRCKRNSFKASVLAGIEAYFHSLIKIYKQVDCFISPSIFLKEKAKQFGLMEKIEVIRNPIDLECFNYKIKNNDSEPYYLYFGRLERIKGLKTLISAVGERRSYDRTKLIIAGDGDEIDKFKCLVHNGKIDNVFFIGQVNKNKLIPIIQNAIATILPSEWYENYPMSALESLACGTPVIGSRIGGIPEIIKDGVNGYTFHPGSIKHLNHKLDLIQKNRNRLVQMGMIGREIVERENCFDDYYDTIIELYKKMVARS